MNVLARLADEWEGLPVTVYHPPSADWPMTETHSWIAANEIGILRNVKFTLDSMTGEVWIPVENSHARAAEIIGRLEGDADPMEVSIGYFSAFERNEGVLDGEAFDAMTIEAAPNHLALLPDLVGACSVSDGCGAGAVAASFEGGKVEGPTYSGVEETSWSSVDRSLGAYVSAASEALDIEVEDGSTVANLPGEVRAWIASKTILGSASASTEAELLRLPVVNPKTDKLNRAAVFAIQGAKAARLPVAETAKKEARLIGAKLLREVFSVPMADNQATSAGGSFFGRRLGAVLDAAISERAVNASDRGKLIKRIAAAANIDEKRVKALVKGEGLFPEDRVIRSIAAALEISPSDLFDATWQDSGEFMRELDPPAEQTPEPTFFERLSEAVMKAKDRLLDKGTGEQTMTRCDLTAKIVAAGKLNEAEATSLKALTPPALAAMAKGYGIEIPEGTNLEAEPKKDPAPAAPAAPAAQAASNNAPAGLTAETVAEIVSAQISAFEARQKAAAEESERSELVAKAKNLKLDISDEDLAATPVATLRAMTKSAPKAANFAAAAGVASVTETSQNAAESIAAAKVPTPYDLPAMAAADQGRSLRRPN